MTARDHVDDSPGSGTADCPGADQLLACKPEQAPGLGGEQVRVQKLNQCFMAFQVPVAVDLFDVAAALALQGDQRLLVLLLQTCAYLGAAIRGAGQSAPTGEAESASDSKSDDNVVDADYTEVDDDKN